MRAKRFWTYLLALLPAFGIILFIHSMIKLPTEPFWSSLSNIYENYVFALALGLSLPYPYLFGTLFLIIVTWISYQVLRWSIAKF